MPLVLISELTTQVRFGVTAVGVSARVRPAWVRVCSRRAPRTSLYVHVSPLVPGLRCTPRTALSPTGAGHSPTSQQPRPPDHRSRASGKQGGIPTVTTRGHCWACRASGQRKAGQALSLPPPLRAPNLHPGGGSLEPGALALTPLHNLQLVAPPWTSASHSSVTGWHGVTHGDFVASL